MPSKRILVVEDEPSIADTLVHALSIESFEPTRVATISKAREALKNNTFAQIIRLLNEIYEGKNSKFPNAIAIFEKIIRTSSLVAESKQKLDNRAYWKSGRVSIDGIAIRLSQSENGNYIKSEFIKKFDQEEK